jgi:oligogalacturonide lyase
LLQVTDGGPAATAGHLTNFAALSPAADRLACWLGDRLTVIDLADGRQTIVYEAGAGAVHGLSWTADGSRILTIVSESTPSHASSTEGRLAWRKAPPLSRVVAIEASGGGLRVLHEERWLITHVNASPTDPDLCTFCHEGPWLEIEQRIWAVRLSGGAPWKVVPRDPQWGVGHEYWLADGRTVGFHARHAEGTWRHAAGFADVLTGEVWMAELAVPTHHAVGQTRDLIILDGTRATGEWLLAVPREGDRWGMPRVICRHDASRHHHRAHVHPRLSRDSRQIVFTSDRRAYSDAYLVDLPADIGSLPVWPGKPYRYYWE